MKIVLVTGGFDPLHSGHIEYFKAAKALGDILVVGIYSDTWLVRKKGRAFMPACERIAIIENLKMVDHCLLFNDNDDTAVDAIHNVKLMFPTDRIIFANGGDRTSQNIPELLVNDIEFAFGVGGSTKLNSSSWILDEWKAPKTKRPWGYYRVLHEDNGTKVKELTILPGKSLSMQLHEYRSEYWHVSEGDCMIESNGDFSKGLSMHDNFYIPKETWHKLLNPYELPCKIVEIQFGQLCLETDIIRLD